jgi:hypothetical protein
MSKKICYLLVMRWALGMTELIEQPSGDGRGQLRPIGQRYDGERHNTPPISSKTLTTTVQNRQTIAHDPATHWKCRIPAREDFELALELLAFGITTSDRIRDRLRRKKQLILQKVTETVSVFGVERDDPALLRLPGMSEKPAAATKHAAPASGRGSGLDHGLLRQDLERSLACGMIEDLGGYHQLIRAGRTDEAIEATADRLGAADDRAR